MRQLDLNEIAWAVVCDKKSIQDVLKKYEIGVLNESEDIDLVNAVNKSKDIQEIRSEIFRILSVSPFHRNCFHCLEPIQKIKNRLK